jgi:hypothetical protein
MYTALGNMLNMRNNIGYASQRLFYNEELRGDYYARGIFNKNEKSIYDGWYANAQGDSQKQRIDGLVGEEKAEYLRNKERWEKNFEQFYPELKVKKYNPIMHKFEEPHFERNLHDIRGAIFTYKWTNALRNQTFDEQEVQSLHEFFLNGNTSAFFTLPEEKDSEYVATPLYQKFVKEMDFPDFFKIDRYTTYPPEHQFFDLMDKNWNINFSTVDSYRDIYSKMMKYNFDSPISTLVLEEVYNPLFREILKEKFRFEVTQTESFCERALAQNSTTISELNNMASNARENVLICASSVMQSMVENQVRKVVRTFHWKGK